MKTETKTRTLELEDIAFLRKFASVEQMNCLVDGLRSPERGYFREAITSMVDRIKTMPKTYETDGQGDKAIAYLHYFRGSQDWWITEKDMEPVQYQAFGLVDLGGGPEKGYVNIVEIIRAGVELDLHWTPKPLSEVAA